MLKFMRGGQRWLTALLVVGVGGVFVFFLGLGGPLTGRSAGTLIEVGPYHYGVREFERVRGRRERYYQNQLGDQYDAAALQETLDALAARELVQQSLLALEAEALGLHVSTEEIERAALVDPNFRDSGGRFDREAFTQFVGWEYGNERSFIEERRRMLLALKMLRLLHSQSAVSEGEAREAVRRQLDEVRIAFKTFDTIESSADFEAEESAVQEVLQERDEELRELYAELESRYDSPEQLRARHILISVPPTADADAVRLAQAQIARTLSRLDAGEGFAELANEVSQDRGTQERGGDLGFFRRGQMVKPFEDAAFALQPGERSDPVRTDFGFHIIQVEERKEAVNLPFESVREELAIEALRREAGTDAATALAERLAEEIRAGASLEQAARDAELTLERSGWLPRRADGFVPGLGAAPELLAAAFAMEPGDSAPRVFSVGDQLALVQVLERKRAEDAEIEPRLEDVRAAMLRSRRDAEASAWLNVRRKALLDAGQLHVDLDSVRSS